MDYVPIFPIKTMNKKTCFVDVDGCITKGPGYSVDLNTIANVRNILTSEKIKLVLVSGRSQPYLEAISQMLGIATPYICENGAAIYDPLRKDYIFSIENTLLIDIKNELKKIKNCRVIIEPGKDFSLSFRLQFENKLKNISEEFDFIKSYLTLPPNCLLTHSSSAIDIVPANVNKGMACMHVAEIEGFDLVDSRGFGDSTNDLSFLKLVGISGAPDNATQDVKESVSYISKYENIVGLFDFFNSNYFQYKSV